MKKTKKFLIILLAAVIVAAAATVCVFEERIKRELGIGYDKVDVRSYSENAFEMPGLAEDFIPQGVCFSEELDMFAVSGYVKGDVSRIYLVDKETGKTKKIYLKDFEHHAGGIASDKKDLWVSSGGNENEGGYIYHMSTDVLKNAKDGDTVSFDGRFQVPTSASALYCSDDTLWVAEFYEKNDYPVNKEHYYNGNHAWTSGYKLPIEVDYEKEECPVPDVLLSIPDKVQGLCTTDSGEFIFSTSYGRKNDSVLYVYNAYENWDKTTVTLDGTEVPLYVTAKDNQLIKTKMPTLMEGTDFHGGKMYVIFESGAKTYSNAKEIITYAWGTDIKAVMEKKK